MPNFLSPLFFVYRLAGGVSSREEFYFQGINQNDNSFTLIRVR